MNCGPGSRKATHPSKTCKAKATGAIFHPRSQCNFQKLLRCHRAEKLQPGYMVRRQDLLTDKFQNVKSLQYFSNFSEDVALPAQDMLHVQFFPRDGNAIISENCIPIAGEKLLL